MKRWERWVFHATGLAAAVTGLAYFWMKYMLATDDPFALVNHPWEPAMLSWHVVTSPAFVLAFGILLNAHIVKQLRAWRRENRVSGLTSLGMFATMAASGYLLQVVTSAALLTGLVWVHVGSGIVFTLAYIGHLVITLRLPRTRTAPVRQTA
jgi:hypothetical protein